MRYLRARLDQPDWMRHPMHQFLVDSPDMDRAELHAWNTRTEVLLALFYFEGDIGAYRERIGDVEAMVTTDLQPIDDASFYAYIAQEPTESETAFFEAFADLQLVVIPPIIYTADGWTTVSVVGSGAALTALVDGLQDQNGVGVEIAELGDYDRRYATVTGGLTDRQYEALETATDLGYYAAPRAASLEAVADAMGVSSSTASELLRRAESRLMQRLVGTSTPGLSPESPQQSE
jgi:predicted DNA binding protein